MGLVPTESGSIFLFSIEYKHNSHTCTPRISEEHQRPNPCRSSMKRSRSTTNGCACCPTSDSKASNARALILCIVCLAFCVEAFDHENIMWEPKRATLRRPNSHALWTALKPIPHTIHLTNYSLDTSPIRSDHRSNTPSRPQFDKCLC